MDGAKNLVGRPNASRDLKILLAVIVTIAVPVILTLMSVKAAPGEIPMHANPAPYGYTISLLLFVMPALAVMVWQIIRPPHSVDRKAVLWAAVIMAIGGYALDFFFAYSFFKFPNPNAVLGIRLPALAFCMPEAVACTMGIVHDYIPIEDVVFYIAGGMFAVTSYIFFSQYWFLPFEVQHRPVKANEVERLLRFSPQVALTAVALVALGFAIKRFTNAEYPTQLPGYYLFILGTSLIPAMVIHRVIKNFVNWRALGSCFAVVTFVSFIWEATLALPYMWWGYKPEYMLGVSVTAWYHIPVEAIMLWLLCSWVGVMLYEFLRVLLHMDRSTRAALFGDRKR